SKSNRVSSSSSGRIGGSTSTLPSVFSLNLVLRVVSASFLLALSHQESASSAGFNANTSLTSGIGIATRKGFVLHASGDLDYVFAEPHLYQLSHRLVS